jgi:hypothetical protein
MISLDELPLFAALLYPSLNIWLYIKLKPNIENEIEYTKETLNSVEIHDYEVINEAPFYVNINNIMLPIPKPVRKEERLLLTKFISNNKELEYDNYAYIDSDTTRSKTHTSHINDYNTYKEVSKTYNFQPDNISINFPLVAHYYKYNNGIYIHNKMRFISSNKQKLVKSILWEKRLPLTLTIPTIAGLCLVVQYIYRPRY